MLSAVLYILSSAGVRVDAAIKRANGLFYPLALKLGYGLTYTAAKDGETKVDVTVGVDTSVMATRAYAEGLVSNAGGVEVSKAITFTGTSSSERIEAFTLTGTVEAEFYGVVTTACSAHIADVRLKHDGGGTPVTFTAATGAALSDAPPGSWFGRIGDSSAAISVKKSGVERTLDPTTAGTPVLSRILLVAKDGSTNTIALIFDATGGTASGAATVYAVYRSMGGGALTPV